MDQKIIDLYDEYTHRPLDRRVFIERLTGLVGSTGVPAVLLALEPNYAKAAIVPENDARIAVARESFAAGDVKLNAMVARPKDGPKTGIVVVVHENRGLNAHIEDIGRRMAVAGFTAVAVDFLTPLGGTPEDADKARDDIGKLDPRSVAVQGAALVKTLKADPRGNGKVGIMGFCWGGGVVNDVAVLAGSDLAGGVVFYGRSPQPADAEKIKAPLLLNYAGLDERINAGVPAYEAALKKAGVPHTVHIYPNVQHAFNNDTSAERYDKAAATLAFDRTIAFFKEKLG